MENENQQKFLKIGKSGAQIQYICMKRRIGVVCLDDRLGNVAEHHKQDCDDLQGFDI
ncbi:MAG: hypothetical protein K6C08_11240 [Oscillospiraceae bacterium]|nr:hypothetical protein [Oscillospiraceae bacterium]